MIRLCDVLSQSNLAVRSYGTVMVMCHCDLDLGDMTLGLGYSSLLGHGQRFCEILSRSNMAVRCYGPDTDCQYVYVLWF